MKHSIWISTFMVIGTSTAGAAAFDLQGSDRLAEMTRAIAAVCGGVPTGSVDYVVRSSSTTEAALMSGTQLVAPMARFLSNSICSSANLSRASGVASAVDAVVVAASNSSAGTCGGVRFSGSITVGETPYTFANWRDVLRVLYAGVQHDGTTDCNGFVRQALANSWSSLFQGTCTSGSCTSVQRLWRAGDRSDTASTFLALLALPSLTTTPNVFCNGDEMSDNDPIRRPCSNDEQVCGKSGSLGLVVPILSTDFLTLGEAFPTSPCTSTMKFVPVANRPDGSLDRCPNGDIPIFGNLCLGPVDASGSPACLATKRTKPAFIFDNTPVDGGLPSGADGRVYNLHLRKPDGAYQLDTTVVPPRPISRAFHRIHSKAPLSGGSACTDVNATRQLACVAQASPCSLSMTGVQGVSVNGVVALELNGVAPTTANIRNVVSRALPIYPLGQVVYMNTLTGFTDLQALDPVQSSLANCFFYRPTLEAAATSAGLVTLGRPPFCQDFNEMAICGAVRNDNACGVSFNLCPTIDDMVVSPLETRVGTTITLSSIASDSDSAPQPLEYLWSTTAPGTIAEPDHSSTLFTCNTPGSGIIKLVITDGSCPEERSVPVTCSP